MVVQTFFLCVNTFLSYLFAFPFESYFSYDLLCTDSLGFLSLCDSTMLLCSVMHLGMALALG